MGTRGAERQSLRQELAAAQDQLEMLKAIQRQMMEQQQEEPSSTPQSRPQSFVSVASSVSEATDGDNTEDGECTKVHHGEETVTGSENMMMSMGRFLLFHFFTPFFIWFDGFNFVGFDLLDSVDLILWWLPLIILFQLLPYMLYGHGFALVVFWIMCSQGGCMLFTRFLTWAV